MESMGRSGMNVMSKSMTTPLSELNFEDVSVPSYRKKELMIEQIRKINKPVLNELKWYVIKPYTHYSILFPILRNLNIKILHPHCVILTINSSNRAMILQNPISTETPVAQSPQSSPKSSLEKTSANIAGLGEPVFAYPPMVFAERDNTLSNWYHIG